MSRKFLTSRIILSVVILSGIVFNCDAWDGNNHMEYVGLKVDDGKLFYSKLNTVFRMENGELKDKIELKTKNGTSLYNSFDNCSKIIEAAWNNKNKNFTDWIKTDSLKGRLENDGALQNGLVLLYSAWEYFRGDQSLTAEDTIQKRIKKLQETFTFKAVETLASDVDWYLNNEKWQAASWIDAVKINKGTKNLDTKVEADKTTFENIKKQIKRNEEAKIAQYSMMIVSKYFDKINDYINVEKCCKEYNGIIEQYHFNPIPFQNAKERELFNNIQTYHFYENIVYWEIDNKDLIEEDKKITKIIHWKRVSYSQVKADKNEKNVYKNIEFGQEDMKKYLFDRKKEDGDNQFWPVVFLKKENIELEEGITSIGYYCFSKCDNLCTINIPSTVLDISFRCFSSCPNLNTITIPNSVSSIGEECFNGCINLKQIDIPESVISIGSCCFRKCSNLSSINIPGRVTSLKFGCFGDCSSLTSITIPTSVSSIGEECFNGCINLKQIDIPESVISIGKCCFQSCNRLTEINIVIGANGETKIYEEQKKECGDIVNLVTIDGEVIK